MTAKYEFAWSTEETALAFDGLHALSFSEDGQWLACFDTEWLYILYATSGHLLTRFQYWIKPSVILWTRDILVCTHADGSVTSFRPDIDEVSISVTSAQQRADFSV